MKEAIRSMMPGVGGVVAAAGSALCCAGPAVAVTLGISGAGLSRFERMRPYFLALTAASLVVGSWMLDREEKAACEVGKPCASPVVRKRMKISLWVATIVAVALATFPSWQELVL